MTKIAELQEQIKAVAKAREQAQRLADEKTTSLEKWERDNAILLEAVINTAEYKNQQENLLRELTLLVYNETGNKKPCEGVGIREISKLDYDPREALKWAMSHQIALSLDKKSFEGFAKATPLDFVTITLEPQATIATDLSLLI